MNIRFSLSMITLAALLAGCGENPSAWQASAAPAQQKTKQAAAAQTGSGVPDGVSKKISATLEKNYADQKLKVQSVRATPMKGLYEVVVNGNQIAYTDENADYMLVGDLIETKEGRSLTDERKAELSAIDYGKLPFDKAIKEVRGKGTLKVAVFSDADCPFCKRLEQEFAKMDDITIYNFMMPLDSLHPDAYRKSVQIWCQSDRTKAWTEWMRKGTMPPKVAECSHPIKETVALGASHNFNGTPTIVFPNGRTQGGYAPMPQLQELIAANQK